MNDYKLINNLLEDGSEQAILKVKVITDLSLFDLKQIKQNNLKLFCEIAQFNYCGCKRLLKIVNSDNCFLTNNR